MAAPAPATPAAIRIASDTAQMATTTHMCSLRIPCRSTKTFWAPMATMSESPSAKPARRVMEEEYEVLGAGDKPPQLRDVAGAQFGHGRHAQELHGPNDLLAQNLDSAVHVFASARHESI